MEESFLVAGYAPDYMGWILSPHSPRRVTLQQAASLISRIRKIHPRIQHVGVFAGNSVLEIVGIVRRGNIFDCLQITDGIGFIENLRYRLRGAKVPLILPALRVREGIDNGGLVRYGPVPFFILDSHVSGQPGGTGRRLNTELIAGITRPYFLAGGLNPDNVVEALRSTRAIGVDVSSGLEESPGRKNPKLVDDFFSRLRKGW